VLKPAFAHRATGHRYSRIPRHDWPSDGRHRLLVGPETLFDPKTIEAKVTMSRTNRSELRYLIAWHLLVLVLLATLPRFSMQVPIWSLAAGELQPLLIQLGGYAACAAIAILGTALGKQPRPAQLLLSIVAVFGLIFLALMLTKQASSRALTLAVFGAALTLIPMSLYLRRLRPLAIAALALLTLSAVAFSALRQPSQLNGKHLKSSSVASVIKTAFYNLHEMTYKDYVPEPAVRGGGLARIGERILLATGDGYLYLLNWAGGGDALSVQKLPYRVPVNGDEFAADTTGKPWHKPSASDAHSYIGEDAGNDVITWWFRVSGILVQDLGDNVRIYAAHYFWKRDQSCWVERVSVMEGARAAFLGGDNTLNWRTLYETRPCLPIKGEGRRRGTPFAGHFGGGRLVLLDPETIMMSVGDFGFNGVASSRMLSQDPSAAYGKAVVIHVNDGSSEIYSSGLRNPQGLYKDPSGEIWETEQGPQGGDELNLLKQGKNYGWPIVTYGTDYGAFKWPLDPQQGEHNGFEPPMYAWLPDIGVSDLLGVEKQLFPVWHGDLLVGALAAERVLRVRIRNQRVAYVEPIPIDMRIRGIVEASDGRIVLWADDDDAIVSLQPAYGSGGEIMFSTNCSGCHKLGDGTSHRIGPDLWGVIGRKVASADGYGDYSAALRALGGKWNEERLDAFIKNPRAVAPGTAMEFDGVADAETRAKIIDYIKHAPKVISR
jgi:aldose sugar dehydrogenase